jgi:hypothetical protein
MGSAVFSPSICWYFERGELAKVLSGRVNSASVVGIQLL